MSQDYLRIAFGFSPSCSALLLLIRRHAVAPSDRKEELAAVTVPPWQHWRGGSPHLSEGWLQLGQLLEAGRPDAVICGDHGVRARQVEGHYVRELAGCCCCCCQLVGPVAELVLGKGGGKATSCLLPRVPAPPWRRPTPHTVCLRSGPSPGGRSSRTSGL